MKHVMVYLKAFRGVSWWPAIAVFGLVYFGLGIGSALLESRAARPVVTASSRPVKPNEPRNQPAEQSTSQPLATAVGPEPPAVRHDTTPPEQMSVSPKAPDATEIVRQINQTRISHGAGQVAENALLNKSASLKAADMIRRNYWAHAAPGADPWATIKQVGYPYVYIGENLAYGQYGSVTPEKVVLESWLNSSGHKANMLNPRFKEIGIAVQKAATYNGRANVYVIVTQYGLR
jgi:uncharacterized protein YkwD